MSKSLGNGLLAFGLCVFMCHVLRALGDTALEAFIFSVIPSVAITIGIWNLSRKEEGET